jgi:integrase
MATIEKRGKSYKITVSKGYDVNGKQLRERMTWMPDRDYTPKQLKKELQRQAVLFEERVRCMETHDGNMRLAAFTELFLKEYARPNLKAKTAFDYETRLRFINQALGHIKLKDLRTGHIAAFNSNLQEEGMRRRGEYAACKFDFAAWMHEKSLSMNAAAKCAGTGVGTIKKLVDGEEILRDSAVKIANAWDSDVADWFTFRRDMTPLAAGSIKTYHRALSAVLYRAVKWGYIENNPCSRADLPPADGRRAPFLDEPDARRLLEFLRDEPIKWRVPVAFDLLSGLRRGELCGLRWQDINFADQTIQVVQTENYMPGRGRYTDTPKTPSSHRPVRLSRSAFALLRDYADWQNEQRERMGDAWADADGRVFTREDGAPLPPNGLSVWFQKFVKRTGLPHVTVHSLRHTYASLMIADGVPVVVVSHQLGHAHTSTTEDIYAHVIKSAEAKAAQTFDRFDGILSIDPALQTIRVG